MRWRRCLTILSLLFLLLVPTGIHAESMDGAIGNGNSPGETTAQKNDEDARPYHAARENQKRAFARKKAPVQAHEPPHDLAAKRFEEAGSVETFHAGSLRIRRGVFDM